MMHPVDERVAAAAELLAGALGDRLERDRPLAPMTTYRVGGAAALFVEIEELSDLEAIATARRQTGVPVLVVGRGSNMLVADEGFAGVALSLAGFADHLTLPDAAEGAAREPGRPLTVRVGGGAALPVVARQIAAAGITGFEWAVGVPGSIGGAIRMNAGGHGSDMAACLIDIDVVDLERRDPGVLTIPASEIGLRFRSSSLDPAYVVLEARLRLASGDRDTATAELTEIVRWRRENQPGGQNCGSVFVNPVPGEVTAGGLVDAIGLRGFSIGSAHVSDKHANFIQATDGGRAADVRAVVETVRSRVAEQTGFLLRSEVRLVGFDDVDPLSFDEGTAT